MESRSYGGDGDTATMGHRGKASGREWWCTGESGGEGRQVALDLIVRIGVPPTQTTLYRPRPLYIDSDHSIPLQTTRYHCRPLYIDPDHSISTQTTRYRPREIYLSVHHPKPRFLYSICLGILHLTIGSRDLL